MNEAAEQAETPAICGTARRDQGTTFIEILVAIVLLGTVVVATMTALYVSIRGSDQHRSKVNAVAELEGAAAYLARAAFDADCSTGASELNVKLEDDRPGTVTGGIAVSATNVTCVAGLPRTTLTATSISGNAIETLDVTLGGISVLNAGGSGSPTPSCSWGSLSANPPTGVNVNPSGKLTGNATISIRLAFTGTCAGPVTATITGQSSGPAFSRPLSQDPLQPLVFNVTLASNEVTWRADTYVVSVPVAGVANASFVIG